MSLWLKEIKDLSPADLAPICRELPLPTEELDCVIVGGGLTGVSVAYHLAQKGTRVDFPPPSTLFEFDRELPQGAIRSCSMPAPWPVGPLATMVVLCGQRLTRPLSTKRHYDFTRCFTRLCRGDLYQKLRHRSPLSLAHVWFTPWRGRAAQ